MTEDSWKFEYSIEQMRLQRHDFMNDLQVIYGFIQIGKSEEAIRYIKKVSSRMNVLSMVFNLECSSLSVLLQDYINFCTKYNVEVEFSNVLECISRDLISKNIDRIKDYFDLLKSKSIEYFQGKIDRVHISIYGKPEDIRILFTNDEKTVFNELLGGNKCVDIINDVTTLEDENSFIFIMNIK